MPPVSLRERLAAVGCGGFVLLSGLILFAVSWVDVFRGRYPVLLGWSMLVGCSILALLAFAVGVRRDPDEDDPFHGDPGIAIALTLIVVVAVLVFFGVMVIQPDFWAGVVDG